MTNITETEARQMGLATDLRDRWEAAADGKLDDSPGAISDLIAELWDWASQTRLINPDTLSQAEAVEVRKELADVWALGSDVEDELHRVKVLGIGADRTAQEVLEDLVQTEREAEEWARLEKDQ